MPLRGEESGSSGYRWELLAPVSGFVVAMDAVPDPVFAAHMVGPGAAINPFPGGLTVISPGDGVVLKAKAHGFVVRLMHDAVVGEESATVPSVLIHMGIDTVKLGGSGFTELVREGQVVSAGQPIMLWNTSVATDAGLSLCSPIVVMGVDPRAVTVVANGDKVEAGKPFLEVRLSA